MGEYVTVRSYRFEREKEIVGGLQSAMEKVGRIVEKAAAQNIIAHAATTPWQKTGQVASSVTHNVTTEGNEIVAEIGTNLKIGKYLELGHPQHPGQYVPAIGKRLVASDVPPYPWLFPAVESNRQNIIDILKGSAKEKATGGMTWSAFTASKMGEYMKTEGGHAGAMKRLGKEWGEYKASR